MKHIIAPGLLMAALVFGACGSDSNDDGGDGDGDTGEVDCSSNTLTYDNYGQTFIKNYCLSCHSAELTGDQRCFGPAENPCSAKAPEDDVFADLDEIKAKKDELYEVVVEDKSMPYNAPASISDAKRKEFGTWLKCGPK